MVEKETGKRKLKRRRVIQVSGAAGIGLSGVIPTQSVSATKENTVHLVEYTLCKETPSEDLIGNEREVSVDIPPVHKISEGKISPTEWTLPAQKRRLMSESQLLWNHSNPYNYSEFGRMETTNGDKSILVTQTADEMRPETGVILSRAYSGPPLRVSEAQNYSVQVEFAGKVKILKPGAETSMDVSQVPADIVDIAGSANPKLKIRNFGELTLVDQISSENGNGGV